VLMSSTMRPSIRSQAARTMTGSGARLWSWSTSCGDGSRRIDRTASFASGELSGTYMSDIYETIVIGAGQAGLATGYWLRQAGLRFVLLEADRQPGGSWPRYYDSLTLFSPARYSGLPGLPFPGDPERYPARDEVVS